MLAAQMAAVHMATVTFARVSRMWTTSRSRTAPSLPMRSLGGFGIVDQTTSRTYSALTSTSRLKPAESYRDQLPNSSMSSRILVNYREQLRLIRTNRHNQAPAWLELFY